MLAAQVLDGTHRRAHPDVAEGVWQEVRREATMCKQRAASLRSSEATSAMMAQTRAAEYSRRVSKPWNDGIRPLLSRISVRHRDDFTREQVVTAAGRQVYGVGHDLAELLHMYAPMPKLRRMMAVHVRDEQFRNLWLRP